MSPVMCFLTTGIPARKNLKLVRELGWRWRRQLRHNRLVALPDQSNTLISALAVPMEGLMAPWRSYERVRVFRTTFQDGDGEYWGINDLALTLEQREVLARRDWGLENHHRGIKWCCPGVLSLVRGGKMPRPASFQAFLARWNSGSDVWALKVGWCVLNWSNYLFPDLR